MEIQLKTKIPSLLNNLTVRIKVNIGKKGWSSNILEWGNPKEYSFRLYTRRAGKDQEDLKWDNIEQNYLSFPDVYGACDILEADVAIRNHNPEWKRLRVGVPAAMIGKNRPLDIVILFSGSRLRLYVDGVLVDEEWPVGGIPSVHCPLKLGDTAFDGTIEMVEILPFSVTEEEIVRNAGGKKRVSIREEKILGPENPCAQYWTPRGHNHWMGDVMLGDLSGFDNGSMHLYYLTDRRHGASKFRRGGHFIAHMSSGDLRKWDHQYENIGLEPWNTIGTGRQIFHNGKLILFYGMHTSRIMPKEKIAESAVDADGYAEVKRYPVGENYPLGTSYAESKDGITFKESRLLVHPAQNPNVCHDETGGFLLLAGYGSRGLWHSKDLQRWKLIDEDLLPVNNDSPTRNSDECQCMFEWNGCHYIIGGRTGYWMSRSQRGPYWEGKDGKNKGVVRPRWDIYEGLWVPMVAPFGKNRRIMAGFLQGPDYEWAGHLVFRELVQFKDGTLGTKWPDEMIPETKSVKKIGTKIVKGADISVDVPSKTIFSAEITCSERVTCAGIVFSGDGKNDCVLSILPRKNQMQWNTMKGTSIPEPVPTLQEIMAMDKDFIWNMKNPYVHFKGCDFAIENVEGLNKPFNLKIVFLHDPKSRSTIIDACMNGQRTMITRRKNLIVGQIRLISDGICEFRNIQLGELK